MNEYALADAFHVVGDHLYGAEWTGREILGRRAEDPQPTLAARKPLEAQNAELCLLIIQKNRDYKQAVGKAAINAIKYEISELDNKRGQVRADLSALGEVLESEINDHKLWERYEIVEGHLLRALTDEVFSVSSSFGLTVPAKLWHELPADFDFDFDFERSLVFWPASEGATKMQTGRIKKEEFHEWLDTVLPIVESELEKFDEEKIAAISLKKKIEEDDSLRRDDYKKILLKEIPKLSGHGFKRVWDKIAPPEKKIRGRRKAIKL